ncbi:mycofactocin biosynthesis peptidyl-dipeptidase MftE [Streptomyces phaeochromogenes]|uniref:mycofactocin biosynthesis peptidyl-dipeptidase MftE n=1 Tax=Streptomyces phaeochromogenes TaxID=1923 RepID=UPI0033D74741
MPGAVSHDQRFLAAGHLSLDTDAVMSHAVAQGAADCLPGEPAGLPLVAPALVYGASGEQVGFPGTVWIGHEEGLLGVLAELVRLLALRVGRIVFVNGHGGYVTTLDTARGQLRGEGHDAAWTGCDVPGGDAHAGRTETSVMPHLAPDQVLLDAAVAGDTRPPAVLLPDLMARRVRAVSPSGVLGDPSGAPLEEGRGMLDSMVSAAVGRIAGGVADGRGRLGSRPCSWRSTVTNSRSARPTTRARPRGGSSALGL